MEDIQEASLTERTYILWRKEIDIKDITNKDMWSEALEKVMDYVTARHIKCFGPNVGVYFTWDEPKGKTDFGIGIRVIDVTEIDDPELTIVKTPDTEASVLPVYGDYTQIKVAHENLAKYCKEKGIKTGVVIEEYEVTAQQAPDPIDWLTLVLYLHEK